MPNSLLSYLKKNYLNCIILLLSKILFQVTQNFNADKTMILLRQSHGKIKLWDVGGFKF